MASNVGKNSAFSSESEGSEEHDWSDDEQVELFADWNDKNKFNEEVLNFERINLESHQLIWYDKRTDNAEYTVPIGELRKIIDYTQIYDNVKECCTFLKRTSDADTFLVCSCTLSKQLIPRIHKLKNVRLIYVFCHNQQIHEKWNNNYAKVKQVDPTDLNSLLSDLTKEVNEYLKQMKDGIFNEANRANNTTDISYSAWWQNFADFICHLPYPDQCRRAFVTTLEKYYQGNESNLKTVREFDATYTSEGALTWYTRDTFLYRLLNSTLRQHNIQLTFVFGFYIKDVYLQLKKEHENFKNNYLSVPLRKVYRAQILTANEFAELVAARQKSGNYEIPVNSYFSTTVDRETALFMLESLLQGRDDNMRYILFEIKIDMRIKSRPFANITHLSHMLDENEVLFMRGTLFRIYDISYDDDKKIDIIKLVLAHDDKELPINHLRNATARATLKHYLSILREDLSKANKLDINAIFMELNELFPTEKEWLKAIGIHCISVGRSLHYWTESLFYYKEALKIYEMHLNDSELNCAVDIALIHLNIGYHYQNEGAIDVSLADEYYKLGTITSDAQKTIYFFEEALKNHQKAVQIYNLNTQTKPNDIADIYEKVSEMYIEQKQDYATAARFKKIEVEYLMNSDVSNSNNDKTELEMLWHRSRIGDTQHELADIYIQLRQYSSAYEILIAARKLYQSISDIYNAEDHLKAIEERIKTVMQNLFEKRDF